MAGGRWGYRAGARARRLRGKPTSGLGREELRAKPGAPYGAEAKGAGGHLPGV
jgi:hypothetical protein